MRTWILSIACVFVFAAAPRSEARTIVHAGHLIDGVSKSARDRVTIVIDAGKIVEVSDGFVAAGSGDEVIDLADQTVLPGLMDIWP